MNKKYFGFAISDSMFDGSHTIDRLPLSIEEVKEELARAKEDGTLEICLNPSHIATINAMKEKYGIDVEIPQTAPRCTLTDGDSLIIMQVRGLPRLDASRHEYTAEEIELAEFTFAVYDIMPYGE